MDNRVIHISCNSIQMPILLGGYSTQRTSYSSLNVSHVASTNRSKASLIHRVLSFHYQPLTEEMVDARHHHPHPHPKDQHHPHSPKYHPRYQEMQYPAKQHSQPHLLLLHPDPHLPSAHHHHSFHPPQVHLPPSNPSYS